VRSFKIDFKAFLRHHYWLGYYYWTNCYDHKHYNTNCNDCNSGEWNHINRCGTKGSGARRHAKVNWRAYHIMKMPMNNVKWKNDTDAD